MKEKFSQNYDSSDETVQRAIDRDAERAKGAKSGSGRSRRRLGSTAIDVIETNREILRVAYDIARNEETNRIDYGRILRLPDGSVEVYNSRAQRDRILAERAKKSRRRR